MERKPEEMIDHVQAQLCLLSQTLNPEATGAELSLSKNACLGLHLHLRNLQEELEQAKKEIGRDHA